MEFLCLVKLPLREKRLLIWQQLPASYTKGFQIWHSSLIISFRAAACFADVYNEGAAAEDGGASKGDLDEARKAQQDGETNFIPACTERRRRSMDFKSSHKGLAVACRRRRRKKI